MIKKIYEIVNSKKFANNFGRQLMAVLSKMKKAENFFSEAPQYGIRKKKGNPGMHCIKLDALLLEDGSFAVNEMDFVPSGRGFYAQIKLV